MSNGDVESIGRHCHECHRLDFLPFLCASCHEWHCGEHRREERHHCSNQANGDAKKPEEENNTSSSTKLPEKPGFHKLEVKCASPPCKVNLDIRRDEGVDCPRCNRRYCMSHRHEEQHDCKNLIPIGARPSTVQQRTQSALSKLKIWAENKRKEDEKRRSGPKKSGFLGLSKSSNSSAAVSAQVESNALKRVAKGDAKVPPEKRIYLHVEASTDTTKAKYPTGKFFYSKDISVGRVLDMAAKALQVENVNNRGGGEVDKLRVFHVEAGRLLKFSEKIGDACQSGNMIVLLRGVGDGEPDLIDL